MTVVADEMGSEVERTEARESLPESLASICTVLAVGLFVMTFVFENFKIPSGSMEKTLLIGDHVLVDRMTFAHEGPAEVLTYHRPARRGDVIVFFKPHSETPDMYLVKRLIGMPGDRIHLRDGVVFLNGVAQTEPYAAKPENGMVPYRDSFPQDPEGLKAAASANHGAVWAEEFESHVQDGDLVVPPGTVFAMGDNRPYSLDSRFWGFVPMGNIVGRPVVVYWSFRTPADEASKTSLGDRARFMGSVVLHFFSDTRWSRTLHLVR